MGILLKKVHYIQSVPEPDYDIIRNNNNFNAANKNNLVEKLFLDFNKEKKLLIDNFGKMHARLLLVLDKEGAEKVEAHPEFEAINNNKADPLALWNLIRKVYITHGINLATNDLERKLKAKSDYDNYYQSDKMSVLDHKSLIYKMIRFRTGLPAIL